MKDSKSLQPAWVFPPFFVWSEDSASWVTVESEEQGAWFLFLPRSCWGGERGVFLKGSRAAGESTDLVWSLNPRHFSWFISVSWLSSHIPHLPASLGPLYASPQLA